ncbi:putative Membrane protein [uncultured Desulfobacterium sp.]|uniref:Putative Membrane protein n=1 Tax=uncultured Desulfobacterium sp. TaxID=201089 RepID=A0A445MQL5_9BACT|nr:putative Membrane protein [uncultured Desulfobacterium sp.]
MQQDRTNENQLKFYKTASLLAHITIYYNLLEGIVSVFFGAEDETLSLFGFGVDSFVEVLSGIGILNMVRRLRNNPEASTGPFEERALKITGVSFYILAIGLVITAGINLYHGHRPETTFWGIVIALISIFTMWALIHFKVKIGTQLNSEAILEDANCTKFCLYLSFTLLLASAGFELTNIGGIDSIGAILIAVLSFREGMEAFEKARGESCDYDGG